MKRPSLSTSARSLSPLSLFLLALCLALPAFAQYRGNLQGTVTDSQGSVVAGANVTLTDEETNRTLQSTTNGAGVYTFSALAPSLYRLEIEKQGFKKKVLDHTKIIAEQPNAVNAILDVGEVTETITVNGEDAPVIDTETASISGTVTNQEIKKMPSFGRDVFQLLQLAPGAFGDGAQGGGGGTSNLPGTNIGGSGSTDGIFKTENGPQIISNGTTINSNNITIDGIGVNSVTWGGTAIITPSEESVKEIKVVSNSYDAENGRGSGAQIQVVSNNGTNIFHGSAFIKADRPGLNAYQRWNGPNSVVAGSAQSRGLLKNTSRFNQFGGSVGGPIWKNKLFGFFSYETLRNNSTSTGTGWYETPQFLSEAPAGSIASKLLSFKGEGVSYSSILSATCGQIGLIEGVNCNTIPGKGLDVGSPLKSPLGSLDPSWKNSGTPGVGGGLDGIPDLALVSTVNPSTITEAQYNVRVDFNATTKDLIAASIYRVPNTVTNYNGQIRAANLWHHQSINQAYTGIWDHTFTPSIVNEARFSWAGWNWDEIASNPQEPWGLPPANFDQIGSASFQSFGAPGPSVFDQKTVSGKDVLTKVASNHLIKMGGEVTRLLFLDEAPWSARPNYNFRNLWDFLNDAPYAESGNFDPLTGSPTEVRKNIRQNLLGFFVQDSYKLKPNLTLSLGLRWEYFGPITESNGNLSTVELGSGVNTLTGLSLRRGGSLYNSDKLNFGPQFGFAWSPTSALGHDFNNHFVVRGGFGIGYTGLEEAISLNGRGNPPLVSNVNFCCSTAAAPLSTIVYQLPPTTSSFTGYPINPNAISKFNSNNLPVSGSAISLTGFPNDLRTMYTYRYSLGGEYELGGQWVASLGYQGSSSHHLTRQYNQNIIGAARGIALNPMVFSVDWYATDANANYNAMLAGVRHQFARSFEFDVQYRLSRSMDDGSQPYYEDPYQWDPKLSWGRSDFNVTNAFKVFGVWTPTIFRGRNSWLEKIAGGWSLSGIMNLHSGFPWTPIVSNTGCNLVYQGSGFCTLRPAAYLGGAGEDYSTSAFETGPTPLTPTNVNANFPKGALAYFTEPQFTQGPTFPQTGAFPQLSTVARNTLTGPRYFDTDMSLSKAFGIPKLPVLGENARFEFRADFFNLFNQVNLNGASISNQISFDGVTSNPNFGQAQSALGARTIEMQLRFSF